MSSSTKRILFVGGDLRQIHAINCISKTMTSVSVMGFEKANEKISEKVQRIRDFSEAEDVYDAIILPLPYSLDGKSINAPFSDTEIGITEIFENFSTKNRVFGGRCDPKIKAIAESNRLMLVDYLCREELAVMNAIPTAEGAIQIAMEETSFTLHSSECLVIGNGRIGKILSKMLDGIGAEVTVAARKKADLAYARAMGYSSLSVFQLQNAIKQFDVIFNTAPSLILDYHLLSNVRKNTLIIDLASKPGGVDFDEARRRGIKVVWALSLPGKVASETAGKIISDTIMNILEEMEGEK